MEAAPRATLAGDGYHSVMGVAGAALLPFFSTREARALRQVSSECLRAVARHPWADRATVIQGSVAAWRASFPHAKAASVYSYLRRTPLLDADFVHFEGLQELDMTVCNEVTDAAFVHLKGIRKLRMWGCSQETITDAAFANLKGIHTLNMSRCAQATITDTAFAHLKGIHTLDMSYCTQATITDAAFAHLEGIDSIRMNGHSAAAVNSAKAAGLRVLEDDRWF